MLAKDLAEMLLRHPHAPVCIDVDDGVDHNYFDVMRVSVKHNGEGEEFIVLDSDISK